MDYKSFVSKELKKLAKKDMTQTEKIAHIAKLWRSKKGGAFLKGGKVEKPKKAPAKKAAKKTTKEPAKKTTRKRTGGTITLEDGTILHPEMLGAGFWSKLIGSPEFKAFSKGFMFPIKAIEKVAKVAGPVASVAKFIV